MVVVGISLRALLTWNGMWNSMMRSFRSAWATRTTAREALPCLVILGREENPRGGHMCHVELAQ